MVASNNRLSYLNISHNAMSSTFALVLGLRVGLGLALVTAPVPQHLAPVLFQHLAPSPSHPHTLTPSPSPYPGTGQQELRDVWTKAHGGSQLGLHL